MRIGIMGAGNVGGGLGAALSAVGHDVVFGVRDPASLKTVALRGCWWCPATAPAEAVVGADVIVFALRWDAVPATVATLPSLAGRIVIDAMNRLDGDPGRSTTQDLAVLLPGRSSRRRSTRSGSRTSPPRTVGRSRRQCSLQATTPTPNECDGAGR